MKTGLRLLLVALFGAVAWEYAAAQNPATLRVPTLAPPRASLQIKNVPTTAQLPRTTTTPSTPSTAKTEHAPSATGTLPLAPPVAPPVAQPPTVDPHRTATPARTPLPASVSPTPLTSTPEVHMSLGTLSPTPEMWFYEQMRQDYNNPALQVRMRAEQEAINRKARIAARAWYGVSLSRPTAHITPFMYHYSPAWISPSRPAYYPATRMSTPVVAERRPYVGVSGFGAW